MTDLNLTIIVDGDRRDALHSDRELSRVERLGKEVLSEVLKALRRARWKELRNASKVKRCSGNHVRDATKRLRSIGHRSAENGPALGDGIQSLLTDGTSILKFVIRKQLLSSMRHRSRVDVLSLLNMIAELSVGQVAGGILGSIFTSKTSSIVIAIVAI